MNALKIGKNQEMWLRYCIEDKVGVCIIDSIPHCHTRMLWKEAKNQECDFVTIKRTKVEYVSSIVFHTAILKMRSKEAKMKKVASFLHREQNWSIYHR